MSLVSQAQLYWNTLRYLKPIQIYRRLWFALPSPLSKQIPSPIALQSPVRGWHEFTHRPQSVFGPLTFTLLNETHTLDQKGDWNHPQWPKLWLYHLHYFDDLNAQGANARAAWHHALIQKWIIDNPPCQGNGWESYPLSLRIVNWIKWTLSGQRLDPLAIDSLYLQARYLNQRIEWHLLGNHLLANAKALIIAGLFFKTKEAQPWLQKGIAIYQEQIPEQILEDGMHFERSPMYHAILLEDILDLIQFSQIYPNRLPDSLLRTLSHSVQKMLAAYRVLSHPDGELGLFNDAAFGQVARYAELSIYVKAFDLGDANTWSQNEVNGQETIEHLPEAGYVRMQNQKACVLLDVAPIGPDYLPGHAHADTLSFEMSLFGQRLIVNGGTSSYAPGMIRSRERSTRAHSTVEINQQDSSEVWGSFRVARRAYPYDLSIQESPNFIEVSCCHNGYTRLAPTLSHCRKWQLSGSQLTVIDDVPSKEQRIPLQAVSRYILHPAIHVQADSSNTWRLRFPDRQEAMFQVLYGQGSIESAYYAPEFGKRLDTQAICITFEKADQLMASVQISWT